MSEITITRCTVEDGRALARNNMPAFWEDEKWRYNWKHVTLDHLVGLNERRYPRILLQERDRDRHFKAVDQKTGKMVGYIRWKLHQDHCKAEDGSLLWPEGRVPDVSPDEAEQIENTWAKAQSEWNPLEFTGEADLDAKVTEDKRALLAKKEYLLLAYLAVHPDNQGKGIGTALIKHGLAKAEELGFDVFVVAFAAGFKVYRNTGFQYLSSIIQDATRVGGNDHYAIEFMEYVVSKRGVHEITKD